LVLVARESGRDQDAGEPAFVVEGPPNRFEGALIPEGVRAPNFSLRNQDGEPITMRGLRGQPAIVTFMYTHCEESCPPQAQQIKGALDQLGHDLPALAVSVDPANDTAESARRFLLEARMLARMDFVLGTEAELRPLWKGYAIQPQSKEAEHQARIVLVDGRGYQRVGYPLEQATPERLAHDLRILEAEQPNVRIDNAPGTPIG
jgi:protein SCO1/2